VTVDQVLDGDEVAGRAMAMIRGWASDVLTRFDGDVSGHGIPGPADAGQVVSPTALEAWATCPHAYLTRAPVTADERNELRSLAEAMDLPADQLAELHVLG